MSYACRDPRSFQRSAPLTSVICGPPTSRARSSSAWPRAMRRKSGGHGRRPVKPFCGTRAPFTRPPRQQPRSCARSRSTRCARGGRPWPLSFPTRRPAATSRMRRPGPPVLFATRSARTSVNCLACGKARARDLTWHWSRYWRRSRPKRGSADRSRRSARLWALPLGATGWPTIPSSSSSSTRWASRSAGPSAPVAWSASFLMTPRSRGQPRNPTWTARCQTRSKWPNACEPGGGTGQRFRPGLRLLACSS
jgi:hypothetical protein